MTFKEVHQMFLPDIPLGQLPGTALSQSRVVDAGRPPTKSDSTLGPNNFSKAGCELWCEGGHHLIETVVDIVEVEGLAQIYEECMIKGSTRSNEFMP